MDQDRIFPPNIMLELTDCFQEWLAFNITYGATHFNNSNMGFIFIIITVKTAFDLIGDMRNYLNGASAKVSASFFVKNRPVNLTGCNIGILGQALINESFIVTKIQVCLSTVIRYKNFTVLDRVHGTWVNVNVWIKFLHGYFVSTGF